MGYPIVGSFRLLCFGRVCRALMSGRSGECEWKWIRRTVFSGMRGGFAIKTVKLAHDIPRYDSNSFASANLKSEWNGSGWVESGTGSYWKAGRTSYSVRLLCIVVDDSFAIDCDIDWLIDWFIRLLVQTVSSIVPGSWEFTGSEHLQRAGLTRSATS